MQHLGGEECKCCREGEGGRKKVEGGRWGEGVKAEQSQYVEKICIANHGNRYSKNHG